MYDLQGSKKLLSSTKDSPIFEDLEGSRPKPRTDSRGQGQGLQKLSSRPPPLVRSQRNNRKTRKWTTPKRVWIRPAYSATVAFS